MKLIIWVRAYSQTHEITLKGNQALMSSEQVEEYVKKNFIDTASWIKYQKVDKHENVIETVNEQYIDPTHLGLENMNIEKYKKHGRKKSN